MITGAHKQLARLLEDKLKQIVIPCKLTELHVASPDTVVSFNASQIILHNDALEKAQYELKECYEILLNVSAE